MSDDDVNMVCSFCSKDTDLDMQMLPNGQPVILCNSCAAGLAAAAQTAQEQLDIFNEAAQRRLRETNHLLIFGALFLATGAGVWFSSMPLFILAFGGCLFLWGILREVTG